MNEHFDDIIKKGLENLESRLPADMFSNIRSRMGELNDEFDETIQSKIDEIESPVPQGAFETVQNEMADADKDFDFAILSKLGTHVSAVPNGLFDRVAEAHANADLAFDGAVKTKLSSYVSEVPADMWDRIHKEKDRRRPVAWWWIAASLLLLLGGAVWLGKNGWMQSHNGVGTDKEKISGLVGTNGSGTTSNGKDQRTETSAVTGDSTSNNGIKTLSKSEPILHQPTKSNETTNGNQTSQNSFLPGKRESAPFSNVGIKQGTVSFNTSQSIINPKRKNGTDDDKLSNTPWNADGSNGENADEKALQASTNINNDIATAERQLAFRQIIRMNLNKLLPASLLKANTKRPELPCPNADLGRSDWYLELYAAPTMAFKRLEDQVNGKNTKIGMDSTLHRQLSFSAGFNIVKNIGEHGLIKTGLQYNQTNEVLRSTRINEIKLVTTISVRTVILSPGDTIYIRDTSVIQKIGTAITQSQNKYKSWDVPVIFGYQFGGENLRLNANLGVIANIRSNYKGEMIDTAQQSINVASYKNAGIYKTNVGLSLYAGLGIVKAINEKMDFLVEPHARINLSNTATNAAWFRQKNITAGVSIGVRYKINGTRQR